MTDLTAKLSLFGPRDVPKPDLDMTRPALSHRSAPVFMSDAVTPLGGETLLSLLLKHESQDGD